MPKSNIFKLSRLIFQKVFAGGSESKESACSAGDPGSISGSVEIPWRREQQPTPVFLPGEFHAQRNLFGYSPCGCRESDTTEQPTHKHTHSKNSVLLTLPTLPAKYRAPKC